jgi:uncharacterized membrane protein (DUF4010 family)
VRDIAAASDPGAPARAAYDGDVDRYEPFASLGLAAAAGLLIGLERERSKPPDESRFSFLGGARTHPLLALVGGAAMLSARDIGVVAVVVPFSALVVLLALNYAGEVWRGVHSGITSETAFLLSFLLGVLALTDGVLEPRQKIFAVASIAVVATFLLSAKPTLHPLARRMSTEDVAGTLKFLIVAVVVLPLLPDRTYGPLDVLNPFQIGVLMVLISGLSFTGYAAIRLFGARRGLGLTGILGGVVSSTAVTLSMARRAKERPEIGDSAAFAVILASTVMFVRVFVIVAVVNPGLRSEVAYPMGFATAGGLAACLGLWLRSGKYRPGAQDIAFSNPFDLVAALEFALLFAVILLGSTAASTYLGTAGTYAAGIVAGSTDVDAITLSMAKLAANGGPLSHRVAATTIFFGTAANTIVKGIMASVAGGWGFGRRVLAGQLALLAAGTAGAAAAWLV